MAAAKSVVCEKETCCGPPPDMAFRMDFKTVGLMEIGEIGQVRSHGLPNAAF